MIKVSLILTTYNSKELLIKTLTSISEQTYENIEVIIQDGMSTDGTIDVITEYANTHEHVKWISEKDGGIYDAMNRGIKRASGDLIVCFNDVFATVDTVSEVVQAYKLNPNCVGVHGDLVYDDNGRIIRNWMMGEGRIQDGWMPAHPTLFLKKEIYVTYGLYDIGYKCSADYEFMIRFLKDDHNKLAYLSKLVVKMFYGGTSTSGIKGYLVSVWESYRALKKNKVPWAECIIIKRVIKVLQQF